VAKVFAAARLGRFIPHYETRAEAFAGQYRFLVDETVAPIPGDKEQAEYHAQLWRRASTVAGYDYFAWRGDTASYTMKYAALRQFGVRRVSLHPAYCPTGTPSPDPVPTPEEWARAERTQQLYNDISARSGQTCVLFPPLETRSYYAGMDAASLAQLYADVRVGRRFTVNIPLEDTAIPTEAELRKALRQSYSWWNQKLDHYQARHWCVPDDVPDPIHVVVELFMEHKDAGARAMTLAFERVFGPWNPAQPPCAVCGATSFAH